VESFHERVHGAQKQKDDGSDEFGGKTKNQVQAYHYPEQAHIV
jgi:hypothetical protein